MVAITRPATTSLADSLLTLQILSLLSRIGRRDRAMQEQEWNLREWLRNLAGLLLMIAFLSLIPFLFNLSCNFMDRCTSWIVDSTWPRTYGPSERWLFAKSDCQGAAFLTMTDAQFDTVNETVDALVQESPQNTLQLINALCASHNSNFPLLFSSPHSCWQCLWSTLIAVNEDVYWRNSELVPATELANGVTENDD